jgi:hypothetical protein
VAVGEKLDLGGDVVDRINDPVGAGDEVVALLAIAPKANFGFNAGGEGTAGEWQLYPGMGEIGLTLPREQSSRGTSSWPGLSACQRPRGSHKRGDSARRAL